MNSYEIRIELLTKKLRLQQMLLDERKAFIELLEDSSRERMISYYREKAKELELSEKQLHKIITVRDLEIIGYKMTIEVLQIQLEKGGHLNGQN